MKNLDLYKLIILASLVLIPAGGVWIYLKAKQLEVAEAAIDKAVRGGQIEKIGLLQKEIEQIKANVGKNDAISHTIYFEKRILQSAAAGTLKNTDFTIGDERPDPVRKSRAIDYEVKIEFVRDRRPLPLPRDFIHAVLFNCESPGMWKLRTLDIVNDESGKASDKNPPPKTVADNWIVRDMVFARRAPDK